MLQRDRHIRTQVHQLVDAGLFAVSFWLAYAVRDNDTFTSFFGLNILPLDAFTHVLWLYFALVPMGPLVLEAQGFYNHFPRNTRTAFLWPLFRSCVFVTVILIILIFIFRKQEFMPRLGMIIFGIISFGLIWAKEEFIRAVLRSRFARAQSKRRVLLAGTPWETARLRLLLADHAHDDLEIVGDFDINEALSNQLVELLHEYSVSGVFVSARNTQLERVETVIQLCEVEGVEAWLVADFFTTQIARASFDEMFGQPLMVFRSTPDTSWQMIAKLLLDFFGAAILTVLAAIPMLVIALLIKFTSPGPVFFRQQRSGLNGKPFTIFKFRTMATNAEQFQHELAAMNEMSGPVFKVTNDPRITPVGKFLRKFSLDELPQLFNVLRSEMSLVGPRPLPVSEVKHFNDLSHRRRLSVKPGITCLWQIKGRNQITDFREWVRLDLEYIDNWSLWLDLKILLLTPPVVLRGTGAK
jgi:exopolysaccharide biosynthesis polyprenyl glycosylphosphotransferase